LVPPTTPLRGALSSSCKWSLANFDRYFCYSVYEELREENVCAGNVTKIRCPRNRSFIAIYDVTTETKEGCLLNRSTGKWSFYLLLSFMTWIIYLTSLLCLYILPF